MTDERGGRGHPDAQTVARLALDAGNDDTIVPFSVPQLDARGRIVRLGPQLDVMLSRHNYPRPVAQLLAEAIALTTLLGASLKFDGRFILQTQTDGPISFLVVDYETPGQVRACARFDADALKAAKPDAALLGSGTLAMTIDQGAHMNRYQGVVPLDSDTSLEDAAHQYFAQSEQIPTCIRLASAQAHKGSARGTVDAEPHWRAGGLIVQYMPEGGPGRGPDLHPGDAPDGASDGLAYEEPDHWAEARMLAETIEDHELIDPDIPAGEVLFRLYHERGVRVFEAQPVREECRCSRERLLGILKGFDDVERADMLTNGTAEVTCEFCSSVYTYAADELTTVN